ncbi:serine protease inhibitor 3/4-like [Nymphalis io]|uniref:serine protease inhibitor 3/4-like n=1 Tax=Inachis io TaxID=171585 RepID=UPI00216A131D|nr:serine protease inhibitor 3/4-like [Nymphalis io]
MKIIIALCVLCTIACKVETQSWNDILQQRRGLGIPQNNQNRERAVTFRENKNGNLSSYDKYIQDLLNERKAQSNKENNKVNNKPSALSNNGNVNVISGVQPNPTKTNEGLSSYDKYIQDVLNERKAEAQSNRENNRVNNEPSALTTNDNVNFVSGVQPIRPIDSEESPITTKPVRFVGVGKTDVEYLNNVTYAITNFGVNLMKSLNRFQTGNIIASPTSIATVLALLQQAVVGEALDEITRLLQMTPDVVAPTYRRLTYDMKKRNSRNILTVSNSLFIGDGFEINPDFKETAILNFGSEVTVMDFSRPTVAVKQINKWVAVQTHNRIEDLLPYNAVNHNTQLVIANAVYFKGLWETKFNKQATKLLIFHLNSGEVTSVPFMRMRHSFKYGIDEDTKSYITIMPFERHQYSLILILPHHTSDADSTLNALTNTKLVSYHNFQEIEVQLEIPKFTIKSDTDMIPVLKHMNVSRIFSPQTDLTGVGTYRTYSPEISQAVHTGYLSVDEQGLSAVGAAGFAAVALSYDEPSAIFQANRPFLAVLWDTQFAIPLFIAKIEDPSQ